MKNQWKGTLMLIGQPAEEIGAGAKALLEGGIYETFGVPNYAVGLHCSPTIPAGKVGYGKGYTMAASESVTITVYGIGAHGASPHGPPARHLPRGALRQVGWKVSKDAYAPITFPTARSSASRQGLPSR